MHCSHKNIIKVSDKTSMPLAAVFSREVINNQTLQEGEDIFPLDLGIWAGKTELFVTVGHAIACVSPGKRITSAKSSFIVNYMR